ncbi:energy-dependent translational throttle protein EttA [Azospirillum sp. RWY-5-1]|uniref:Energy-dependent translational throttle protein EttA n=1 Tax=Azospirillum oleiclasticum TaxID=2735135 RepID=A0ABX2TEP9_9PROT|nr:energy-dependent translational throttle protein EttA [Azospirillum oleiclasticum]NYZ14198.1 energy-dependent translational throttle protein EttA [Azospirillum oleiclasticum]NYZ21682.1 energy-dependent translational throttle protein EttA [Azospirillum oleiclasticum]
MASYQYVYVMKGLTKVYPGGKKVLDNVWLSFYPGAKIGVIGVNGSGKSTLLKIMAGLDKDYNGEAWSAEGAKVGYLPQEPQLDPSKTVQENVLEALKETKSLVDRFNEVSNLMAEPDADFDALLTEQAELQEKIDAADAWDLERTVDIAMDALRCPPGDSSVDKLSGGEKRRVALCKLLLEKPDLLLLDEPTNHLDAESVAWLERHLEEYKGTVVLVTHDRYFLDNVTGWILELDRGQGIPYEGAYSAWLEQKQKRLEQEGKQEQARQKQLAGELDWIRASPRARQAKSKARIAAYETMLAQQKDAAPDQAQIVIPAPPRLGDLVIEADGIAKGFGDRLLIDGLSFKLPPGGIVGIIGPNGAGKTTLFRMITGQDKPDSGSFRVGETVVLGYVDQSRDTLDGKRTVWEEISDGLDVIELGKKSMPSRAYVAAFNFKGSDQQKKVGQLSGGERNRVHLAKMLKSGANVLLLDEPTNDLDVDTLRALEDALADFAGCAVVISHDRWFLDRIATHILAFEGDSHVEWFEGNFQDYEADKKRRLGADADQPHRIKYKPLVRG